MLVCYEANGFIRQTLQEPVDGDYATALADFGMTAVSVADDHFGAGNLLGFYANIETGAILPRPPLSVRISKTTIAADDTDEAVISGLPDPCMVTVDGDEVEVTGGVLSISSPMPGPYHVAIKHWPYLDWETTVEAVA